MDLFSLLVIGLRKGANMGSNLLSPEASPDTQKTGVRRLNKMPIYIIGGMVFFVLVVLGFIVSDKGQEQAAAKQDKTVLRSGSGYADDFTKGRKSGIIESARPPAPPPRIELPPPTNNVVEKQPTFTEIPAMPVMPPVQEMPDQEAEAIRAMKMQMLQQSAMSPSKIVFNTNENGTEAISGASSNMQASPRTRDEMLARLSTIRAEIAQQKSQDPTAAYKANLAQAQQIAQSMTIGSSEVGGAPIGSEAQVSGGQQNAFSQFEGGGRGDRWRLNKDIEFPRTPFEIRAGAVIPSVLVGGINSDIPGFIIGQVSQNVYDTATGSYLLIPQGSKLFGEYSSNVAYGQSRVLVAWQRITFPDGKVLDIGSMAGADQEGYSGYKDKVNHHYIRLFGSAILMSAITAGVALSQDDNSRESGVRDSRRASDAMSEALGQQLGAATSKLLDRNLNIAPTIEIRPGYRFNIIATKDLTFYTPYNGFDYQSRR